MADDQQSQLLTREVLTPQRFRESWPHALVQCFEAAATATAAAQQTATLLTVAVQGERGLLAQTRKAIDEAVAGADKRATQLTREHLEQFESTLTTMTGATLHKLALVGAELAAAAENAQRQRAHLQNTTDELHAECERLAKAAQRIELAQQSLNDEREKLEQAKRVTVRGSGLFGKLFGA